MVNHNVRVTFAVRIADGIATGVWASSVLSTYINVLEGDTDEANERVGYAQAIQGTFLAVAAVPAGWLAIKYRRDSILRVMALVAFAAIGTTSAALVLDVPYKYGLLCCGLALWGVAQANAPVLDALFADSVPTGDRSRLYTWLHMCYIVAQGIGPGVGALMFYLHGNVWRLEVLQRVMLVGMCLAALPALLMLLLDDDKALGAESEGLLSVALLSAAAEEQEEQDEEAPASRTGRRRGNAGDGAEGEGEDGGDYRRPFLEGWSSDVERAFRHQVSAEASPARPVLLAGAGFGDDGYGGGSPGGGGDNGRSGPADGANGYVNGANGYAPPDVVLVPGYDSGGQLAGSSTSGGGAAAAAPVAIAGGGGAAANGDGPLKEVQSFALQLSPASASPFTDRSGAMTPVAASPPRGLVAAVAAAAASAGDSAVDGPGAAPGAAAAAAADRLWSAGGASRQLVFRPEGTEPPPPGLAAAAANGDAPATATVVAAAASTASPPPLLRSPAPAAPTPAAASFRSGRSGSQAGSAGGGESSPSGGGGGSPGGDGDDSVAGGSQAASVSGESLPSELSFSSLLAPGSFKAAHSVRPPFSRTASSSSAGSTRGGSLGGGPALLAAAAAPPHGLLPYPEEDPAAEADVSDGADTPALADSPPPLPRPAPTPTTLPTHAVPSCTFPSPLPQGAGVNGGPALPERWGWQPAQVPAAAAGTGRGGRGGGACGGDDVAVPLLTTARAAGCNELKEARFLCLTMAWIPGVLALTDCIMGLASGMTIKFFPIFFKDEVQLPPMYVNLMYCAIPLCLSAAAFTAQRQSRLLGRVQTMVLNRGLGISLLVWIATHANRWHEPRLMVPVYIARTSIMNSIYPLQKSILMDFVPKERRAAWNSLESVTSFGWSGSAALGGWLIHRFGFQMTFLITAVMQTLGWAMSTLLLPIVPRKEAGLQAAVRAVAAGASSGACSAASTAPTTPRPGSPQNGDGGKTGPWRPPSPSGGRGANGANGMRPSGR